MTRIFVILPEFEKQWSNMRLNDNDLQRLQEELVKNPQAGVLIPGTGGLRKIRFAFENRGKSGSSRVAYVDFAFCEKIYLITAYSKNDKENLTKSEQNSIKKLIEILEKSLKGE